MSEHEFSKIWISLFKKQRIARFISDIYRYIFAINFEKKYTKKLLSLNQVIVFKYSLQPVIDDFVKTFTLLKLQIRIDYFKLFSSQFIYEIFALICIICCMTGKLSRLISINVIFDANMLTYTLWSSGSYFIQK